MTDEAVVADLDQSLEIEQREQEQQRGVDRRQRMEDLFRVSQAPSLHTENLDLIDGDENHRFVQLRDDVVSHLTDAKGFLIAFLGKRGCGKTEMAVSIIHANCQALRRSLYYLLPRFFSEAKAGFNGQRDPSIRSEAQMIEMLCRPHLLVLDECHQRAETPWEQDKLVQVIDRRYGDRKCTIMIANQSREAFAETVGDSIVSRMNERGWAFPFDWPSYRVACTWQPFDRRDAP
jgi:DNA replication protein DnaC